MIFSANNVSFSYKNGNTVFDNVSLEVKSGETVALLGANGSGKTTLLKCLMGFYRIDSGTVTLDGEDVSRIPDKMLWSKIAYVPQAKTTQSSLEVEKMIMLGCAGRIGVFSSPGKRERELAEKIADRLGIKYLFGKKCTEISGGERQMVLIARALAAEPEMLILDEPESNLDFRNQLVVLDTVKALADDGISSIMSTHYPDHALSHADKSLLFTPDGAIFGDTPETVTSENIRRAFGVDAVIGEVGDGERRRLTVIPTKII